MSQPENAKDGVVQTHEDLIGNDGPFDDDYDPSDYDLEFMAQLAANDLKANQETQEERIFFNASTMTLVSFTKVTRFGKELGFEVKVDEMEDLVFMPYAVANELHHEAMADFFEEAVAKLGSEEQVEAKEGPTPVV